MNIKSAELMNRTGASYRQIDYWCRLGIISPVGSPNPGSGSRKMWDEALVDKVRFLTNISAALDAGRGTGTIKKFSDAYNSTNSIDLGFGITLVWRHDEVH